MPQQQLGVAAAAAAVAAAWARGAWGPLEMILFGKQLFFIAWNQSSPPWAQLFGLHRPIDPNLAAKQRLKSKTPKNIMRKVSKFQSLWMKKRISHFRILHCLKSITPENSVRPVGCAFLIPPGRLMTTTRSRNPHHVLSSSSRHPPGPDGPHRPHRPRSLG